LQIPDEHDGQDGEHKVNDDPDCVEHGSKAVEVCAFEVVVLPPGWIRAHPICIEGTTGCE